MVEEKDFVKKETKFEHSPTQNLLKTTASSLCIFLKAYKHKKSPYTWVFV